MRSARTTEAHRARRGRAEPAVAASAAAIAHFVVFVIIGSAVGPACVYEALRLPRADGVPGDVASGGEPSTHDVDGNQVGDDTNDDGGPVGGETDDEGGPAGGDVGPGDDEIGDGQSSGGDGSVTFVPSNVPNEEYWDRGSGTLSSPMSAPGGITLFIDTDTGEISLLTSSRAPGEGVDSASGIYFEVLSQGAGFPSVGLFVLDGLHFPEELYGMPVYVVGTNALALLVKNDVVIANRLLFRVYGSDRAAGGFPGGLVGEPGGGPCGGSGTAVGSDGAGGGGYCGSGGAGANGGGGGAAGGDVCGSVDLVPLVGGSGGGGGAGGIGGYGGGAIQISARGSITVSSTGVVSAGGRGGQKGVDTNLGGGGGGAGGAILLEAPVVRIDGTVAANGGGGGTCGDATSATGGTGLASAARAAGGTGCQGGGGDGGKGSGQTVITGDNGQPDSAGGGGGAGRIRINALGGTVVGSGIISPGLATSCTE